ncbi:MAG: hypothetical protein M0R70_02535 [Nitrospirae bacterium]|nr:hypothetical protein [Nitrospirota bacterium]
MNIRKMMLIGVLILVSVSHAGANEESDRINGVADFLLDRGRENYLYLFEQSIKDNKAVKCYFPTIYSNLEQGDLRLLLKSRKTWKNSVDVDLKNLMVRVAAKELSKAVDFKRTAMDVTERYLEFAQYISVMYEGIPHPLTVSSPVKPPQDLQDLMYGFYAGVLDMRDSFLKIDAKLKNIDQLCETPEITIDDIPSIEKDIKDSIDKLNLWKKHFEANKGKLVVDVKKLKDDCQTDPSQRICKYKADALLGEWSKLATEAMNEGSGKIIATFDNLEIYYKQIMAADTNTAKAIIATNFLEKSKSIADKKASETFKEHVLFFAELSDAESSGQAKEVLNAYMLPPVSFAVKREKYRNHILISSYLGYLFGEVRNSQDFGDKDKHGIYAPIGLEYSHGFGCGSSMSFMIAPFDFGNPINLKLNGINKNVDLNEIVAPSFLVSYDVAKYPLSIGVAYQKGRKSETTSATEERLFLFVGFDMPLFTLY